jgi:ABC-type phosphate transport system auxiliary subunit
MTTPKLWTKLVDDAVHRHMSRWRLGEIAAVVREADTAWATQVEALDTELIKYVDMGNALKRDRDMCERERDAYRAEAAALRARLDAVREALGPALEAEAGATPGEWTIADDDSTFIVSGDLLVAEAWYGEDAAADAALIAAAVNGVRQARAALEGEGSK